MTVRRTVWVLPAADAVHAGVVAHQVFFVGAVRAR